MRALIDALNSRFAAAVSGRNVLLVLIAALLVFSLFNSWLVPAFQAATNGRYPIDMVMPTTPAVLYQNYAAYTGESIRIYHRFLVVDFIWPPLLDLLDNAGFLVLLENYPVQLPAVVWATAVVRYTKLALYGLCWLITLMFIGLATRRPGLPH